jgi:hypothetical protein
LNLTQEYNRERAITVLKQYSEDDTSCDETRESFHHVKETFQIPIEELAVVFVSGCFTKTSIKSNDIRKFKTILASLILPDSIEADQMNLLLSFESFCTNHQPSLAKLFPLYMKNMFEEELVSEQVLQEWKSTSMNDESKAALVEYTVPFYEWLEHKDDESDDSDSDSDSD